MNISKLLKGFENKFCFTAYISKIKICILMNNRTANATWKNILFLIMSSIFLFKF